jgi:hypothetical protein
MHTLEELLGAIQTLGRQLVVTEGTKELADEDIGLLWGVPHPHVGVDHGHIVPALGDLAVAKGDDSVGVLVDGVHLQLSLGLFGGSERPGNQRASAGANHHEDGLLIFAPLLQSCVCTGGHDRCQGVSILAE